MKHNMISQRFYISGSTWAVLCKIVRHRIRKEIRGIFWDNQPIRVTEFQFESKI